MSRSLRWLAVLIALALLAAACGGSDDDASGDDDSAGESDGDQQQVEADRAEGDAEGADEREADTGPVYGGRLVYGIEADSDNPWTHYATSCPTSCRMIFRTITDSLFITDDNGDIQPYLVESVEINEDATVWTLNIREGIEFHDGTPLDGAAVKYNIDTCRFSGLTGPAFIGLAEVEAEGQAVTLTYDAPEAIGPTGVLRAEVCGQMFSPTWMATLANNPFNLPPFVTEEEAAELGLTGDPAAPVGLGAFVFESYTPGPGGSFVATRNENYWRGDGPNSTGEGFPYLDAVELVVAVDIQGRSNGLRSGEFDIIHTANADEIARYEGDDEFVLLQANDFGETNYVMLNSGQGENPTLAAVRGESSIAMDPGGLNASSPMIHLSCRKALAHALDRELIAAERYAGLVTPANGPFPPGSIGYLEDSGYPAFDLEAAATEWEQCKADHGTTPVAFGFTTSNDAFNVETNEFIVQLWVEAFGDEIDVTVNQVEQGQLIGLALTGVFQAFGWRNHAGVQPAEQWFWWSSATASPINPEVPELALNFGRFQDQAMDIAFANIRQNPDPAARQAAAEEVNRLFAENVWNLWTVWTLWGVIADTRVQNITDLPLPDGGMAKPILAGKHHLAQIWCLEGDCQG